MATSLWRRSASNRARVRVIEGRRADEAEPGGNHMTIAETLATHIAGVSFDALPGEARHWAKVAIMDTVGCILAGADEPCARISGRVAAIGGANGPCVVFGTAHRVGPMDAATINGTAAHALDYDDCSDTMGGHPS